MHVLRTFVLLAALSVASSIRRRRAGDNAACPLLPKDCYCFKDGYVSCSNEKLRYVPLHIPTNATYLDLSYNMIESVPYGALTNLVHLQQLSLSSNKLTDSGFTEQSITGLKNLTSVDVSSNPISTVPMFLHPGITYLTLSSCMIDSLPALDRYTELQSLMVSSNLIATIASNTFEKTKFLLTIYATNNKISSIAPGSFQNLAQLQMLILDSNLLTSPALPSDIFIGLWSLRNLSLARNPITEVPNFPQSVINLNLVGTNIKTIKKGTFAGHSLDYLFLGLTPILTIESGAFAGMRGLGALSIANTHMIPSVIRRDMFGGIEKMFSLMLRNCSVGAVDKNAFEDISGMYQLRLWQNQITTLDEQVMTDLNRTQYFSQIFLSQNPWWCDCNLRWLKEHTMMEQMRPYVIDPYSMTCAGPPSVQDRSFHDLSPKDFRCE